ncbi:hypothetical protein DFR71_4613 [Nocardia alba]|uniref:Uncharacterized protein n=1 Tax=Nocardia alba TaxID=225051 RepID=A0A4R1FT70_9NOCA|nr:hypothetical protein DFR71_4613 [Nocardia alba]
MNQGFHSTRLHQVWCGPTSPRIPPTSTASAISTKTPRASNTSPASPIIHAITRRYRRGTLPTAATPTNTAPARSATATPHRPAATNSGGRRTAKSEPADDASPTDPPRAQNRCSPANTQLHRTAAIACRFLPHRIPEQDTLRSLQPLDENRPPVKGYKPFRDAGVLDAGPRSVFPAVRTGRAAGPLGVHRGFAAGVLPAAGRRTAGMEEGFDPSGRESVVGDRGLGGIAAPRALLEIVQDLSHDDPDRFGRYRGRPSRRWWRRAPQAGAGTGGGTGTTPGARCRGQ